MMFVGFVHLFFDLWDGLRSVLGVASSVRQSRLESSRR